MTIAVDLGRKTTKQTNKGIPGSITQSVKCLATDSSMTADLGVQIAIPARSHTFMEIDHEKNIRSFSSLPLNHSRRVVVSYKRKFVHKVLVNCLFKLPRKMCGYVNRRSHNDHSC